MSFLSEAFDKAASIPEASRLSSAIYELHKKTDSEPVIDRSSMTVCEFSESAREADNDLLPDM